MYRKQSSAGHSCLKLIDVNENMVTGQNCTKTILHQGSILYGGLFSTRVKKNRKSISIKKQKKSYWPRVRGYSHSKKKS